MKYTLHKAGERGKAEHGWLHSRFSFSFAEWYDPSRMGFGVLRVINDDIIDADSGFDLHPHNNMEIITIVTHGTVTHGDSMGNQEDIVAGDVQVMSAGTGVIHSEHNNSLTESLELFQIWIQPKSRNIVPRYDQKSFALQWKRNALELLVSPDGRDASLSIHQDAFIFRGMLREGQIQTYNPYTSTNGIYILVTDGALIIDTHIVTTRDALGIEDFDQITMQAKQDTHYLIFEVPMIV